MAEIKPFKPLFYNNEKVDMSKVVMPPYDIIKEEEIGGYYSKSEYNICRVDRGKEDKRDGEGNDKYTRAGNFLEKWKSGGILKRNKNNAYYICSQEYMLPEGIKKEMTGFFAAVKIEEFDKKIVLPHEKTHSGPKEDRLKLMRETKANTSPILSLYFDEDRKIDSVIRLYIKENRPLYDFYDDKGMRYRLWEAGDEGHIKEITEIFRKKQLYIADGHHRYETALNFRNEMKKKKEGEEGFYNYIMMCLISMEYSGISILPTHRVFKKFPVDKFIESPELRKFFSVEDAGKEGGLKRAMLRKPGEKCIGAAYRDKEVLLTLKKEEYEKILRDDHISEYYFLDVCILHILILRELPGIKEETGEEEVVYTQDADQALAEVKKNSADIAFLLRPSSVEEVKTISNSGEIMPQKSTYFLPKLATGLLINPLYK